MWLNFHKQNFFKRVGKIWKVIMIFYWYFCWRAYFVSFLPVCVCERKWFPFHSYSTLSVKQQGRMYYPLPFSFHWDEEQAFRGRKIKTTRILLFCHYFQFSLFNGIVGRSDWLSFGRCGRTRSLSWEAFPLWGTLFLYLLIDFYL